jgi:hypothetical protein
MINSSGISPSTFPSAIIMGIQTEFYSLTKVSRQSSSIRSRFDMLRNAGRAEFEDPLVVASIHPIHHPVQLTTIPSGHAGQSIFTAEFGGY